MNNPINFEAKIKEWQKGIRILYKNLQKSHKWSADQI